MTWWRSWLALSGLVAIATLASGCGAGVQSARLDEARVIAAREHACPKNDVRLVGDATEDGLAKYFGPFFVRWVHPPVYAFVLDVCGQHRCYRQAGTTFADRARTDDAPCGGSMWRDILVIPRHAAAARMSDARP
jgi:hypothetical protein